MPRRKDHEDPGAYDRILRRPLVGISLCFMLGVGGGLHSARPSAPLLAWALGWGLIALLFRLHASRRPSRVASLAAGVSILACVVWTGAVMASLHPLSRQPGALSPAGDPAGPLEVYGIVTGQSESRVIRPGRIVCRFPLRVDRVEANGAVVSPWPSSLDVSWYSAPWVSAPRYGERWQFRGTAVEIGTGSRRRPIFETDSRVSRRLSRGHGLAVMRVCAEARRHAAARLALGIEDLPEAVHVLHALLLGYRGNVPRSINQMFAATGTLHIFAISGLHVGIVTLFIVFVLRALRVSRVSWVLYLAPLLIGYTLATGAKASAVRACTMAIVYALAPLLRRKADSFSALAMAGIVILVAAPRQLFDFGFMLSFTVVAGLLVLYPLLSGYTQRLWRPDPMRVQPESTWRVGGRSVLRYMLSLATLSVAAWLAAAPLSAFLFGRFTPIALLGNIIVIPLAFLIVLSGCLSLVLGSCAAWLSVVFNHAAVVCVKLLVAGVSAMSRWPGGSLEWRGFPLWGVLLWYALLGLGAIFLQARSVSDPEEPTPQRERRR